MLSELVFSGLVAALVLQRLWELRLSRRNEQALQTHGGREHAAGHFLFMKLIHAMWLGGMVLEVWLLSRPFHWWIAGAALAVVTVGQILRYTAIFTLGERWTVRVMTVPGAEPVHSGIYRYLRHPNYVGVVLELAAFPLIHCAYLTALFGSLANALVLLIRIRCEERALGADNNYDEAFQDQPRFVPRLASGKCSESVNVHEANG